MTDKCACVLVDWFKGDRSVTITLFCPVHREVKKVGIVPVELSAHPAKEEGEKGGENA